MSETLSRTNLSREHSVKRVFHPMAHPNDMDAMPPRVISRGEGVYVFDDAGHKTVDAGAGLWNVNLGYSNHAIKEAIASQLEELPYYSAFKGSTNERLIELSHTLAEWLEPENIKRFFFTSGGSDSVETALRLARQFWKLQGQGDRIKFLSLKRGYHGTHFGGASVNGNSTFRRSYEPLLPGCFHVAVPFDYRNVFGVSDAERLTDLCLAALEDEIQFQGGDTIAAFIAEPVLGAGGVIVPPPNYWPRLKALLDRYGILLIADEVITGFGRTGSWFGCRGWGVQPDLMCLAKALTCGYFPLGAVAIGERVERAFKADNSAMGTISHGYTYSGHPVGCAAALACLRETAALDVVTTARREGDYLLAAFRGMADRFETIGNVRGKGLMMAIEVVSDRAVKTPAGKTYMAALAKATYEAGALVRVLGHTIILSPALVIKRHECDEIVAALQAAFAAASGDPAS
ncbi:aminotransferase class III-fold pyridoxal phosphate-dependent enzyme [Lichenifustis flavocetrariae]|uniref:Aminotransferase class III-fold pyridoxal phosphate-dependent enzyme n=1 Tax=Lichenifustis flavocetrariae TaxID=2949735 RepID=A0AA42CHZ9_9HYPH|nr:aminotransferase class III-fold pyridoxal phosphate-dependent enzyme [Lichenifustis flavocetrariae]MCW6507819.1 aminotransferase class III-fold pyridoxal phosphate-dependent enzyme [Lichenifustis flavocetrariae]